MDEISDWIRERNTAYTWLGDHVQQLPSAILWFDRLITAHGIGSVVELGTGIGTLTVLFGMRCPNRVITVDIEDRRSAETCDLFYRLGICYCSMDLHELETIRVLTPQSLLHRAMAGEGSPMLLFIDGGNKEMEFLLYTDPDRGLLKPGDLVMVHDCGSEFIPAHVEKQAEERGLQRCYVREMDADKTRLAVYRAIER